MIARIKKWLGGKLRSLAKRLDPECPMKPAPKPDEVLWYLPAQFDARPDLPRAYPSAVSCKPQPQPWVQTTRAEYEVLRARLRQGE